MKRKIFITISWVSVLAVCAFIFAMSAADGEQSSDMSGSLLLRLRELTGLEISSYFIRKAAHFSEFALLSFLTSNSIFVTFEKKSAPAAAFAFSCVYAVTDELHQLFSAGRACSVKDMLIDSSGAAIGALVFTLIILVYIKMKKHIERNNKNGNSQTL